MVNDLKIIPAYLFCIVSGGNASFLRMNRFLRGRHYQMELMSLQEFERQYREVFYLEPYRGEEQTELLPLSNEGGAKSEQRISADLFLKLSQSEEGTRLLVTGQILLLRKNVSLTLLDHHLVEQAIQDKLERMIQFTQQLTACLRLTRYPYIDCYSHFAYLPTLHTTLQRRPKPEAPSPRDQQEYCEKDNYLLGLLLSAEQKISEHLRLTIIMFSEALKIKRPHVRYLQLLMTLEACFAMPQYPQAPKDIAHYAAALVATSRGEHEEKEQKVMRLYDLKSRVLAATSGQQYEESLQPALESELTFLELLLRVVIRKLLRYNFKDKRTLLDKLSHKYKEPI